METLRIALIIAVIVDAATLTFLIAKEQHNLVLHTIMVVLLCTLAVIDVLGNRPLLGIIWIILTAINIFSIKFSLKVHKGKN